MTPPITPLAVWPLFSVLLALAAFPFVPTASAQSAASGRPNVLLIVSDDQGYNDLGVLNNEIITPHLDRLAREGTRLSSFYVTWPACTPSRAGLLTGRYPPRNGIVDMIRNEAPDYGYKYRPSEYEVSFERIGGMDVRELTIANHLKSAGYQTAIFGKWDLGSLLRFLPTSRGFDEFYGFVNTGIDYYTHERYGVPSMFRNLSPITEDRGEYCTELFKREALRFINDCPKDVPFFLYVPFNAPHNSSSLDPLIRSSIQAPEEFKKLYPPVEQETRVTTKHRYASPATVATPEARRRDYCAAVTCMDAAIGAMLERLESKGRLDNTIVIFFSDNGGGGGADNAPLRGKKATMWEGGLRVPCLVRWPKGGVPAGVLCNEFLTSLELVPSLAASCGVEIDDTLMLDGFNWWPTLVQSKRTPRTEMFWQRRDQCAARVGKWKWVRLGTSPPHLFNLEKDVEEQNDVAGDFPDVTHQLTVRFQAWQAEMLATDPRGPFRDY